MANSSVDSEIMEDSASTSRTAKAPAKKKLAIEWAEDMTESLIDVYQAKDCLWDMSKADYKT